VIQRIGRISPGQSAKVMGILYTILGVLFAPFMIIAGLAGSDNFGLIFGLLMPIAYGVIGVISGALGSVLYNLVARWVGGFELELTDVGGTSDS
jgi:hypothetical protein